jgi:hypothetical protein
MRAGFWFRYFAVRDASIGGVVDFENNQLTSTFLLALDCSFIVRFHSHSTLCPSHRHSLVELFAPSSSFPSSFPPHRPMPIHQFPSPPLPGSKPKGGGTPNGRSAAHASMAQPNGHSKVSHAFQGGPTPRSADSTGSPLSSLTSSMTRDETPRLDEDDDFDDIDERTAVGPSSEGAGGMRHSRSGGVSLAGTDMDVDEPEESDWDSEEEGNDNRRVVVHSE